MSHNLFASLPLSFLNLKATLKVVTTDGNPWRHELGGLEKSEIAMDEFWEIVQSFFSEERERGECERRDRKGTGEGSLEGKGRGEGGEGRERESRRESRRESGRERKEDEQGKRKTVDESSLGFHKGTLSLSLSLSQ